MKRYEQMSKESIIEILSDPHHACDKCVHKGKNCTDDSEKTCMNGRVGWLYTEAEPRVSRINTVEDLENAYGEFEKSKECLRFLDWLKEADKNDK